MTSKSALKLSKYDIERIVFYHGEEIVKDKEDIKDIILKASEI